MIIEERRDGTALLRIDWPPANALSNGVIDALQAAVKRLAADEEATAVVLTATGSRFFSAGGDIKELETLSIEEGHHRLTAFDAVLEDLGGFPKPFVCAVNGHAVGGGFELCLFADHVVSVPDARFGFPEINHGILPLARGMERAVHTIGYRNTRRLLYSGELVDAEEARAFGAVDEIVESADVVDRALEVAEVLAAKGSRLFAGIKRTLNAADIDSGTALRETTLATFDSYFQTDDMRNGIRAFLDKR
jgi:enoyl-CoA hydratase/carnithine racemase